MLLYGLCVTVSILISKSRGLRLVLERLEDGFPFIYMQKHCTRRCASTALLVCFYWMWFCFDVCWPEREDSFVCMAKVSRSNTSFQKVKYLSPIYNSRKIIGSKILFPKNVLYVSTNMYIRFLWLGKLLECLCLIIEASLPSYISNLSIPLINNEYFTIFVKCHN